MSESADARRTLWLENVPEHWKVLEPRRIFALRRESEQPGDEHLTPSQKYGVLPQKEYMSITGNQVVQNLSGTKMQHVEPGDFVSHLRTFQGGLELARMRGKVSPAYTVVAPRESVNPEYYKYALKSQAYISQISSVTDQLRDGQSMRYGEFNLTPLPVPPASEQRAIADYLDHETAEIDAFISSAQLLLQLSKERLESRSSLLLLRGVEHCLRETAEHRIPWLLGISLPAHWQFKKLTYIAKLRSGDQFTSDNLVDDGEFPVYGGGGMRGHTDTYTHTEDRVLIGRQGALAGKVFTARGPFFATEHAIVVTHNKNVDLRWLESILRLMNLGQYSVAAAQPGIGVDTISKLKVPEPPVEEQREIGEALGQQYSRYTALKTDVDQAIALARERRAALITAAVTGQIDVTAKAKPAAEQLEDDIAQGLHREN